MMTSLDSEINYLRTKGYRVTPQRIAVLKILHSADSHMQAADIYRMAARTIPGINEATIYRTVEFLAKEGVINRCYLEGSQIAYEIARQHHHLVCRICGADTEIHHDMLLHTYALVEEKSGYHLDAGHLIFYGVCPNCQKDPKSSNQRITE
jgi:Fe2+ or Zn2+ uptake regulation protein